MTKRMMLMTKTITKKEVTLMTKTMTEKMMMMMMILSAVQQVLARPPSRQMPFDQPTLYNDDVDNKKNDDKKDKKYMKMVRVVQVVKQVYVRPAQPPNAFRPANHIFVDHHDHDYHGQISLVCRKIKNKDCPLKS